MISLAITRHFFSNKPSFQYNVVTEYRGSSLQLLYLLVHFPTFYYLLVDPIKIFLSLSPINLHPISCYYRYMFYSSPELLLYIIICFSLISISCCFLQQHLLPACHLTSLVYNPLFHVSFLLAHT